MEEYQDVSTFKFPEFVPEKTDNYVVMLEVTEKYPIIIGALNEWDAIDAAITRAKQYRRSDATVRIIKVVSLED